MKKLTIVVVLVCVSVAVSAQTTLVSRFDGRQQSRPSYTLGIIHPAIEVWGLALPDYPDIEIGKLFPVPAPKGITLLAGGYAVSWPRSREYFVLPWVYAQGAHGNLKTSVQVGYYTGINTKTSVFFSDESSLTYTIQKRLDLGLATSFWQQPGAYMPLRFGPVLKTTITKNLLLSARAMLFGGRSSNSYRLELTTTF